MGVLKVRCPETGREVSTGIEIDSASFASLPDKLPVSTDRYAASTTFG